MTLPEDYDVGASGHVAAHEATNIAVNALAALAGQVGAVLVVTGDETRPASDVVMWVSPNQIAPVNVVATDIVFMPSGDVTAPTAPTGLAASAITDTGFTVSWTASTDTVGVTGYEVEVGGTVAGSPTGTSLSVTGLAASTPYTVRVRARDGAGNWSTWASIAGGATTSAAASALFIDTFNRANGAVGNGWVVPAGGSGSIVSNVLALQFGGWDGYGRVYQASLPKNVSVRAVFAGTINPFHGVFLGHSATTGTGIKLFNVAGTWVIGNSASDSSLNTTVAFTGTPSTPYTTLRLDFDGTTVTAYINATIVHTATLAALGITLDTATGTIYQAGYCGEAATPGLDSFEVWPA